MGWNGSSPGVLGDRAELFVVVFKLDVVRAQIKQCVRDKRAISATMNFTFNNSAAKGRKFVNEVVPGLVEVEVAVPRSRPAVW